MTVKELVEELQKQPADATVCIGAFHGSNWLLAATLRFIKSGRRNVNNHRFTEDSSIPWGTTENVVILTE